MSEAVDYTFLGSTVFVRARLISSSPSLLYLCPALCGVRYLSGLTGESLRHTGIQMAPETTQLSTSLPFLDV